MEHYLILGVVCIILQSQQIWAAECESTGRACVKDCSHMKDGDYQSCTSCHHFVKCSNGKLYEFPCPAHLEWDDNARNCVAKSETCKECVDVLQVGFIKPGRCPYCPVPGKCAEMCHSDLDCKANWKCCYNGCGYNCMAPSKNIEEDDSLVFVPVENSEELRLSHVPRRKHCKSTGPYCVSDCTGKKDGDYQSCHGCDVYVSCVAGLRYDDRPCAPGGLVWDDKKKRCEYNSSTCDGCACPKPCNGTGPCCINSCKGLPDGNYQSCKGCDIFVTCSNGHMYDKRPCAPKGTVWDDNKKTCCWYSNTCHHCHHKNK